MTRSQDERWMAAALAFGRRHLGETGSNPAVGALVVRDGCVVGRGATQPGGRPHAETQALLEAGDQARGATLYVTLEPCSHHGVTPPCADAVITAGVGRVVSALEDPDPRVAGRGHRALEQAKIELVVGVCGAAARRAHRGHIARVTQGRPMINLKLAETADGFAAGETQDQRLRITGAESDARVHILRSLHDAIMVGAGTIRADDPLLTIRLPGLERRRPLRVALDTRAQLPLRSRLVTTARDWPTLAIVGEEAPAASVAALELAGLDVEHIPGSGRLDLSAVVRALAKRGLSRVFCEGGPTLASALVIQGLVDEAVLFRGPMPLARPGLPALSHEARSELSSWRLFDEGRSGRDSWTMFERMA